MSRTMPPGGEMLSDSARLRLSLLRARADRSARAYTVPCPACGVAAGRACVGLWFPGMRPAEPMDRPCWARVCAGRAAQARAMRQVPRVILRHASVLHDVRWAL